MTRFAKIAAGAEGKRSRKRNARSENGFASKWVCFSSPPRVCFSQRGNGFCASKSLQKSFFFFAYVQDPIFDSVSPLCAIAKERIVCAEAKREREQIRASFSGHVTKLPRAKKRDR